MRTLVSWQAQFETSLRSHLETCEIGVFYSRRTSKNHFSRNIGDIKEIMLQIILEWVPKLPVSLKHAVTFICYFLKHGGDSNDLIRRPPVPSWCLLNAAHLFASSAASAELRSWWDRDGNRDSRGWRGLHTHTHTHWHADGAALGQPSTDAIQQITTNNKNIPVSAVQMSLCLTTLPVKTLESPAQIMIALQYNNRICKEKDI